MDARREIRRPVVAGQFYDGRPEGLRQQIEQCYLGPFGPGQLPQVNPDGPRRVVGLVVPHAGYPFSGGTASQAFYHLAQDGRPDVAVILGPNHALPAFAPAAVQASGGWATPLGVSPIEEDIAAALRQAWPELAEGMQYFSAEHSLEVELPFLQHLYGEELPIVPVIVLESTKNVAHRLGDALAQALAGRNAVIVASTDLSHDFPRPQAEAADQQLIERILAWDADGLVDLAPRLRMCGYAPVAAMLLAARALGATQAKQLAYSHSGMILSGRVVGYTAIAVER
ncbi:MAG: AmmeMemoRadiSam system protein B [Armatimonadetes bacterium]|nr:AmmeMemoRadiSam system protein B [Armatimonadota bacterium]